MNKVKFTYEQPSCENLVVRFEENIMSNGQMSSKGTELMTFDVEEDF